MRQKTERKLVSKQTAIKKKTPSIPESKKSKSMYKSSPSQVHPCSLSMRIMSRNSHQALLTIRFESQSEFWFLLFIPCRLRSPQVNHTLLIALLLMNVVSVVGVGSRRLIIVGGGIGHCMVARLGLQLRWLLLLLLRKVGGG